MSAASEIYRKGVAQSLRTGQPSDLGDEISIIISNYWLSSQRHLNRSRTCRYSCNFQGIVIDPQQSVARVPLRSRQVEPERRPRIDNRIV